MDAEGIGILQCNERAAGQSMRHFHVHVIPRFMGDPISKFIGALLGSVEFEKGINVEFRRDCKEDKKILRKKTQTDLQVAELALKL